MLHKKQCLIVASPRRPGFSGEPRHRAGFSLAEVLVSLLVLSLGVIGAAGMLLAALRTTHQSALQSTALQLAAEMADKMRANDVQLKLADSANPFLSVDYRSATDEMPAAPSVSCYASDCSSAQLADFDIRDWERRIAAELPAGRVRICRDATPWDESAHALTWSCAGGAGQDASVVIKLGWQGRNPDGSLVQDSGKQFPPAIALTVEPYIE